MDTARLKESFARVAVYGDEVPLFFYSDLFIKHPEVRDLFPISMQVQRDHLVGALVQIVSKVDDVEGLTAFLQGLGRDHRKFGAVAEHYDAVGASLLTTLAHFSGQGWSQDLAADWQDAYDLVAGVMTGAAQEDEAQRPPYWLGTVVGSEHRAFDIVVIQIRPEPRLDYLPGQSVSMEIPIRPRLWRYYSMANAPRADGTIEFHIRMVDGGALSMPLASGIPLGTVVRLGAPVGLLTLGEITGRPILMVAGSTGLAPLKAILEQVCDLPEPPEVQLFFGARTPEGLYDLPSLNKMAAEYPWLTLTTAVSAGGKFDGETGELPDVVTRHGSWSRHEAYVAGPTRMVHETADRLAAAGMPRNQIHIEDFGWSEP